MPSQSIAIPIGWYLAVSLITFLTFAHDKRTATTRQRRTPERTLHTLELLGGFPGAIAAMFIVRHKNRKPTFVLTTLLIAAIHVAAWIYVLSR